MGRSSRRRDREGRKRSRTRRSRRASSDSVSPRRRRRDERAHPEVEPLVEDSESITSRESDFARLADVLASIASAGSKRSSNNFINEKCVPEFDPRAGNMSADEWIDKVNGCAAMYDWDGRVTMYLAVGRLRGHARIWYDGLHYPQMTWDIFADRLRNQFPGEISFGKLLKEAANYVSQPGQDLSAYCLLELGKLHRLKLNISELQQVDFVAQGISDENKRATVLAARCKTIVELNDCLSIFP